MPTLKNTYSYVQENIAIVEINYGHQKVGYILILSIVKYVLESME